MGNKICSSCSSNNPSEAKFCLKCGEKFSSKSNLVDKKTINVQVPQFTLQNSWLREKLRQKAITRAVIGIVCIAIILFYTIPSPSDNSFVYLIILVIAFFTFRRLFDLDDKNNEVYKFIKIIPGINSLSELSAMVDEAKADKQTELGGKVKVFGDIFIFDESFWDIHLYYLPQCTWIYKRITSHKAYGLVTISKSYDVIMHFPKNISKTVSGSEEQVNDLLYKLSQVCPKAKLGYT